MRSLSPPQRGAILLAASLIGCWASAPRAEAQAKPQAQPVAFTGGFDTRIRQVSRVNLLDFDRAVDWSHDEETSNDGAGLVSDADLLRVRHRLWGKFTLRSGPSLTARATCEWWRFINPWRWNPSTGGENEVILDNLFIDIPHVPYVPASLRIGRQDLTRGEGFILMDGGPLDGSRSLYQNAILLGLDGQRLGLKQTKLELLAIRNLAWDPMVIANGPSDAEKDVGQRKIVEWEETAFGLYVTQTSLAPQTLEAYYIYKEQEFPAAADPFLKLSTLGARVSGALPYALKFAAEGAYQFGTHAMDCMDLEGDHYPCDYDHRSYGGYLWLARPFMMMLRPTVKLGAVYLSGDDEDDWPDEPRVDRSWVPVFSRWPEWSELYIYTLIGEARGVAYWTNLRSLNASVSIQPTGPLKLSYTYHALHAPEPWDADQSRNRGSLHAWLATTDLGRHTSMHFLVERLKPGDFYGDPVDDAWFIRTELMLKY